MADPDLATEIEANAEGPQRMSGDMGSVTQHSLPDQIAADKYLKAGTAAGASAARGLRFTKLVASGSA